MQVRVRELKGWDGEWFELFDPAKRTGLEMAFGSPGEPVMNRELYQRPTMRGTRLVYSVRSPGLQQGKAIGFESCWAYSAGLGEAAAQCE